MKIAKLIHNPTAGDEEHNKKELISTIKANGFECIYSTTKKKSWKNIEPEVDFLIAAGGDGTVRRITKELLGRKVLEKTIPIALLPLGTSNNVARTLEIFGTTEEIIQSWHTSAIKKFDVGIVSNDEQLDFFLESFGYGIFPYLMGEMKKQGKNSFESPEAETQGSLQLLHRIALSYEPRLCHLEVNGEDYSGEYLLAEVMNTRSIGPSLLLAPDADPGDGEMEVVLLTKDHKEHFASYVEEKIKGIEEEYLFDTYKAKEVKISWAGTHVHTDDKIIKVFKSDAINIEVKEGLLQFLVPQEAISSK